jgi:hypothetical protein
MPLDHECPKILPCSICNPSEEVMVWVHKLESKA